MHEARGTPSSSTVHAQQDAVVRSRKMGAVLNRAFRERKSAGGEQALLTLHTRRFTVNAIVLMRRPRGQHAQHAT